MNDYISKTIECDMQKTKSENVLALIKSLEGEFNTGPIIGEAKELLFYMAENILVRDFILATMGVNEEIKEKLFLTALDVFQARDDQLLKTRSK